MKQIALGAHVLPYFAILSPWKLNINLLASLRQLLHLQLISILDTSCMLVSLKSCSTLLKCNHPQQYGMYMQSHQIDTLLKGQGLWLLMRRNTMKRGSPCSKYLTFLFIMGHKSNDCYRLHDCSTKTPSILIFIQSVSLHCSCCTCLLQHPDNCIQFSCISLPPW